MPQTSFISEVRATPQLDCLKDDVTYGDFRDDLVRDGFAVVKGVLSQDKCNKVIDQIYGWLEEYNGNFKRDDPSTYVEENLPCIHQKGLIQGYGVPHENFTWEVRSDPNVIAVFEKLFGTEELISSFDASNVCLPRKDMPEVVAWPHQDQDPERPGLRCVQGFANLVESGDIDGGLWVLPKSHVLSAEYHEAFKNEEQAFRWTNENYTFKDTGMKWFADRGITGHKVNCAAGDIVLWDSRTVHWNSGPTGDRPRFVVYTCYLPASIATKEELELKKKLFEAGKGHSHWPMALQPFIEQGPHIPRRRDGTPDPRNLWKPRNPPVLSERAYKLTGIPYLQAMA